MYTHSYFKNYSYSQTQKPWRFLITLMHWNVPTSKAKRELFKLCRGEKETSRFRKSLHFSGELLIKIAAQRKRTPHCPGTQTSRGKNRNTAIYRSRTRKEIRTLLLKRSRQQRQKSDLHCLNNRESDYFAHYRYIGHRNSSGLRYSRVSAVPGTRRSWSRFRTFQILGRVWQKTLRAVTSAFNRTLYPAQSCQGCPLTACIVRSSPHNLRCVLLFRWSVDVVRIYVDVYVAWEVRVCWGVCKKF